MKKASIKGNDFREKLKTMGFEFKMKNYLETNREFLENVKGRIYTDKEWEWYLNRCDVIEEETKYDKHIIFIKKSLDRRTSDKYKLSQN